VSRSSAWAAIGDEFGLVQAMATGAGYTRCVSTPMAMGAVGASLHLARRRASLMRCLRLRLVGLRGASEENDSA